MSIGLDWINDVAKWIGDLIPDWDLLQVNEAGVKFLPGGKVKVIEPGIYWWWPHQAPDADLRTTTHDP